MEKQTIINETQNLFPADSHRTDTATIGRQLLSMAMNEAGFNWRDLPESVLKEYLLFCKVEKIDNAMRSTLEKLSI